MCCIGQTYYRILALLNGIPEAEILRLRSPVGSTVVGSIGLETSGDFHDFKVFHLLRVLAALQVLIVDNI